MFIVYIVHYFKNLGSTVTDDCLLDEELDCRIQCATTSFGRLWDTLWSSHDISNKTKLSVYTAAITSALLAGAETWTLYQNTLCDCDASNKDIYEPSSVFHTPTESPLFKLLIELLCPILR